MASVPVCWGNNEQAKSSFSGKKKRKSETLLSLSSSLTSGGSIRIERKSDWSRKHADAALFVDGLCPLEDIC